MAIRTLTDDERRSYQDQAQLLMEVCARMPETDFTDLVEDVANSVLVLLRGGIYFPARPPRLRTEEPGANQQVMSMPIGAGDQ